MKIDKIVRQHRNDFSAELICEHCGNRQVLRYGYDDAHYHEKVIPTITCLSCKKNRAGEVCEHENPDGAMHVP